MEIFLSSRAEVTTTTITIQAIKGIERTEIVIGTEIGRVDDHGIEMKRRGDHPSPDREVSPRKEEDRDINGPEAGPTKGNMVAEETGGVQEGESIIEDIIGMDEDHHRPSVSLIGAVVVGMTGPGPEVVPMT